MRAIITQKKNEKAVVEPSVARFVKMQKAVLPLAVIQNAAKLQEFSIDDLNSALEVSESLTSVELNVMKMECKVVADGNSKIVEKRGGNQCN